MKPKFLKIISLLLYVVIIYGLGFLWLNDAAQVGVWMALVLVPMLIGAATQFIWDPKRKTAFMHVGLLALGLTALVLVVLLLFGVEAVICIAMAAPIVAPLEFLGVWFARRMIDRNDTSNSSYAALILLPIALLPFEGAVTFPLSQEAVVTEIIIDAPRDVVWNHTVVIPEIQPEERIWTFSHALLRTPKPVSAAVSGDVRRLRWTQGILFKEIITDRITNQRLAWEFDFYAPETLTAFDPHISPNSRMLKVKDGRYELFTLADGRTKLRLETHYQIRTPFNAYVRLWGHVFLNDFQNSVLAVIKTRAEAQG